MCANEEPATRGLLEPRNLRLVCRTWKDHKDLKKRKKKGKKRAFFNNNKNIK